MEILPEQLIDNWIGYLGPRRKELFAPLRPSLIARPPLPDRFEASVAPALRLLEAVGVGAVPLNKRKEIKRAAANRLNYDARFDDPSPFAKGDSVLEVDVLLTLLRVCEATDPLGWKESLTHLGHAFMHDPAALWYGLAGAIGLARPGDLAGDIVEVTLAWLLRDELGSDELCPPVNEAAAVRQPKMSQARFEEVLQFAIYWTYTNLRALNLFIAKDPSDPSKPRLTEVGRAAAREALRAAAATAFCHEHATSKLQAE